MKDDHLYLEYILQCIERIHKYTLGERVRFMESELIQDAVLRNLHTVAESTQRISDELKSANSQVDWRAISGFRNILVHNYLGLDLERVWGIVQNRLPSLKLEVERMLGKL